MSHNSLMWFIKLSNLFSSKLISCNLFVFLLQHLICPLFAVAIYQRLTVIPIPPALLMWMPAQPKPRLAVLLQGWQSSGCRAAAPLTSCPAGWLHTPPTSAVLVGNFTLLRWDVPTCPVHSECRGCPSVAVHLECGKATTHTHHQLLAAADESAFRLLGLTHTLYLSLSMVNELYWYFAARQKTYKS